MTSSWMSFLLLDIADFQAVFPHLVAREEEIHGEPLSPYIYKALLEFKSSYFFFSSHLLRELLKKNLVLMELMSKAK